MSKTPVVEEVEQLHKGFLELQRERLRLPCGTPYDYYTIETVPFAVSILSKFSSGKYLVLSEYRHAAREYVLGCPGGFLEVGEDPLKGAERELLEETGYHAETLSLIGKSYPMPGLLRQQIFFVLAEGLEKVSEPRLETAELLTSRVMDKEELRAWIREGRPIDGTLCTALMMNLFVP